LDDGPEGAVPPQQLDPHVFDDGSGGFAPVGVTNGGFPRGRHAELFRHRLGHDQVTGAAVYDARGPNFANLVRGQVTALGQHLVLEIREIDLHLYTPHRFDSWLTHGGSSVGIPLAAATA